MIPKELEPTMDLVVPQISPKTSNEELKKFSSQSWTYDGRRRVAADIFKNGQELLEGSSTDWDLVLRNIRVEHGSSVQYGGAAIAAYSASMTGGLAVASGWSMHDPAIVYLSGKCLANIVNDKLRDFKNTMREAAVMYGQKALPNPILYMQILDFLLELRERSRHRDIINQVVSLLRKSKIEEAYKIVKPRDDLVKTRG